MPTWRALVSFGLMIAAAEGCHPSEELPASPPALLTAPLSTVAVLCGKAEFSVVATGTPPLTYQWSRNGAPLTGADAPTYSVPRASLADDGAFYRVAVSNAAGTVVSDPVLLSVADTGGPVALALDNGPQYLAVDGVSVYWTSAAGVGAATLDCSGSAVRLDAAAGSEWPVGISLVPGGVAWVDGNLGHVSTVPRTGGSPTLLADLNGPGSYELVFAGGLLYWTNFGDSVYSVSLDGVQVRYALGASSTGPADVIAADDAYVYWEDFASHTVDRMPLGGGAVLALASMQGQGFGLAADGAFVYWTDTVSTGSGTTGTIERVPRDGGTPSIVATQADPATNLALDAGFVYWTTHTAAGTVSRAPLDGSAPPTVLVSGLSWPLGIAVDATSIYWTDEGSGQGPGRVMRMAK